MRAALAPDLAPKIHQRARIGAAPAAVIVATSRVRRGAPDRNRTCGLPLRRRTLYPTELRGRTPRTGRGSALPDRLDRPSYGAGSEPEEATSTVTITTFEQARAAVRAGTSVQDAAAALVAAMTPEERLWCLDGDAPAWAGVGFISERGYHRAPFHAARVDRVGLPGFAFADGPRGCVIGNATAFPVTMARGATWDPELEERVGEVMGRELRAAGATLTGAVCVNVLRHPAWGRAQETYGEDPFLVGELGAALTRGLQRHVLACVKHFACNSMENARLCRASLPMNAHRCICSAAFSSCWIFACSFRYLTASSALSKFS